MSWIHLDDLIGIILYCIDHDNLKGAINVNGTSPNPAPNPNI
jgi:NAD dependent epimerase/dehydratase family enzyme